MARRDGEAHAVEDGEPADGDSQVVGDEGSRHEAPIDPGRTGRDRAQLVTCPRVAATRTIGPWTSRGPPSRSSYGRRPARWRKKAWPATAVTTTLGSTATPASSRASLPRTGGSG